MAEVKALGFLGGSFDPIHKGHLNLARGVRRVLHLDKIILIPNAAPPHKQGNFSSYESRVQMTNLALSTLNHRQYQVSRLEQDPSCRHYTFDTLQKLRATYGPQTRLYFIMGMDSLLDLDTWHRGTELTDFANLAVIDRPGFDLASCPKTELCAYIKEHVVFEPGLNRGRSLQDFEHFRQKLQEPCGNIFMLRAPLFDVSSTRLRGELAKLSAERSRRQLQQGSSRAAAESSLLQQNLCPQVLHYISTHRLYQQGS